ncbi:MAG: hypothetical protein FWE62_02160 [Firmicutes bacterium]|nr:hypothetical protein [Bacillota bacterium]
MDKMVEIRDGIADFLKEKYGALIIKTNDFHLSAVDISFKTGGITETYRIAVVKNTQNKIFPDEKW